MPCTPRSVRSAGSGVAEMIDRCCRCAERLVLEIGGLPGAEVLARPVLNQGLVRFLDPAGDHDGWTDEIIRRIQAAGVAWFGPTTWRGRRAIRVSVVNWRTSDSDVDRTIASVRDLLDRPQLPGAGTIHHGVAGHRGAPDAGDGRVDKLGAKR